MSNKIKVRFNYGGQNTVLINQAQKGPVDLTHLGLNSIQPVKQQTLTVVNQQSLQITKGQLFQDNLNQLIKKAQKKEENVQSKENQVLQKTILNTYKSQQVIPNVEPQTVAVKVSKKSTFKIEDINETEFNKNPQKPIAQKPVIIQKVANKQDTAPSITAPNFKTITKQGKPVKQYTKVQNASSYQYSNIPVKDEDEFTGCFGCMKRKPKSYSIEKK